MGLGYLLAAILALLVLVGAIGPYGFIMGVLLGVPFCLLLMLGISAILPRSRPRQ